MAHHVTIYSTPPCPFCQMAKEYFREHNVAFTDINVQEDERGREEMITKSHQLGVPVIDIDGEILIGFQKETIAHLLSL